MDQAQARHEHGEERWFYCLPCGRAWSARTWRRGEWACPSTAHHAWPEFHPHIGWSQLRQWLPKTEPVEGGRYTMRGAAAARIRVRLAS